ncbi:DUF6541 family protein [Arthrobacter sp. N199823]|uniref:DUF6541 family protein n=1 Tax=Arthrobacter sp. N199823 TaxID=2058895 RepID=UPI000CE4CCEE|nr:DUF6541 family protein [Arthrobacter sp. N199823]
MTWLQIFPTLVSAMLIVFLPGAILARCLGARGMTWLGVSAPLSVTLIGVGAITAQMAHVRWSLLALVLVTALAALAGLGIRYWLVIRKSDADRPLWNLPARPMVGALLLGIGFGATVVAWRFTRMFIAPENISQSYDNVFHLSALRLILDSGNGSSRFLGSLQANGPASFYPAAWHDLVALVIQTSNASIPVGINSVNIVIGALVWTVSGMYLATRIAGVRPSVVLVSGALTGAFGAFPYLLVDFGVLYPNYLAIAILPAVVALGSDALGLSFGSRPHPWLAWILLAVATPGLALAHPSVFLALAAYAIPLLLFWLVKQCSRKYRQEIGWAQYIGSVVVVLVYLPLLHTVWGELRPSEAASFWPPTQTIAQALGEALTSAPLRHPISWVILGLTVVGLLAITKDRKKVWFLGIFTVGIMFYVVASGFAEEELRSFITGVFYNDSFRLAAMLPVAALPLTVLGAVWLFDSLSDRIPNSLRESRVGWIGILTFGTLAALALGVAAQDNSVDAAQESGSRTYSLTPNSPLLSTDEAKLISRSDDTIPAGATVIGNPATGASLVYALANRNVILPAVSSPRSDDDKTVTEMLGQIMSNPAVCESVERLNAFYVLDFGLKAINKMVIPFPTSEELAANPGLTLIDQEGQARLYRIDACN